MLFVILDDSVTVTIFVYLFFIVIKVTENELYWNALGFQLAFHGDAVRRESRLCEEFSDSSNHLEFLFNMLEMLVLVR